MQIIAILILITSTTAQACPYCREGACQIIGANLGTCSACTIGALIPLVIQPTEYHGLFRIGVCQPCSDHCLTCNYTFIYPSMSSPFPTLNCTKCADGYVNDISFGNCVSCPDNCLSCHCVPYYYIQTDPCKSTSCDQCAPGYALVDGKCLKSFAQRSMSSLETEEDKEKQK